MDAFEIAQLIEQRNQQKRPYLEFLRTSSLSLGLYMLPAGGVLPAARTLSGGPGRPTRMEKHTI